MSTHCTYCQITWAHLRSIEGEGEEVYEVCPECGGDMHLIETAGEGYIKCEISGEITHALTGERFERPAETVQTMPLELSWPKCDIQHQLNEDAALNAYFEQGEEAYFKAFKKKR